MTPSRAGRAPLGGAAQGREKRSTDGATADVSQRAVVANEW